jgi:hypothetical protein
MAGTIEDRRFPDGVYFGQTDIARRSFEIFVTSTAEFLSGFGAAVGDRAAVGGTWRDLVAARYANDEIAGRACQRAAGPIGTIKVIENNTLDRCFSVAPLMDWTDSPEK